MNWNQIYQLLAQAAGAEANLVHLPSELINAFDPKWGSGLLGDKTQSMIFDNTKIKRIVPDFAATIPYAQGAREILAWYNADPARQEVDETLNHMMDKMIKAYESIWPSSNH